MHSRSRFAPDPLIKHHCNPDAGESPTLNHARPPMEMEAPVTKRLNSTVRKSTFV